MIVLPRKAVIALFEKLSVYPVSPLDAEYVCPTAHWVCNDLAKYVRSCRHAHGITNGRKNDCNKRGIEVRYRANLCWGQNSEQEESVAVFGAVLKETIPGFPGHYVNPVIVDERTILWIDSLAWDTDGLGVIEAPDRVLKIEG
jgi:hypothetical protein